MPGFLSLLYSYLFLIWVLSFVYKHSARSRIECASTELCHHSISPHLVCYPGSQAPARHSKDSRNVVSPFLPSVWLLAPTSYLLPYQSTLSARTPHAFTSAYSGVMMAWMMGNLTGVCRGSLKTKRTRCPSNWCFRLFTRVDAIIVTVFALINSLHLSIIHIPSTIPLSVQSPPRSLATLTHTDLNITTIPLSDYSRK